MSEHDCQYGKTISLLSQKVGLVSERVVRLDTRINGSLEKINEHIENGKGWRTAILGIVFTMLIEVGAGIYYFGRLTKQVEINTDALRSGEVRHGAHSKD